MTLIAYLSPEEFPVLLGDVLLSREVDLGERVHLPSVGLLARGFSPSGQHYISGLRQKICLINDSLVMAWSGKHSDAKKIAIEAKLELGTDLINPEIVSQLVEKSKSIGLETIFVSADLYNKKIHISSSLALFETDLYGSCVVGGSGTTYLCPLLISGPRRSIDQVLLEGEVNKETLALHKCNALTAEILANELHTEETLDHYFGGAIEMCYFDGNIDRFVKFGDTLTVLMAFNSVEGVDKWYIKPVIIKSDYHNDIMVIRRLEGRPNSTFLKEDKTFFIPPTNRDLDVDELSNIRIDWSAKYLRVVTLLIGQSQRTRCIMIQVNQKRELDCGIKQSKGRYEFFMESTLKEKIRESIHSYLKSN